MCLIYIFVINLIIKNSAFIIIIILTIGSKSEWLFKD